MFELIYCADQIAGTFLSNQFEVNKSPFAWSDHRERQLSLLSMPLSQCHTIKLFFYGIGDLCPTFTFYLSTLFAWTYSIWVWRRAQKYEESICGSPEMCCDLRYGIYGSPRFSKVILNFWTRKTYEIFIAMLKRGFINRYYDCLKCEINSLGDKCERDNMRAEGAYRWNVTDRREWEFKEMKTSQRLFRKLQRVD